MKDLPAGLTDLAERVRLATSRVALFPLVRRLERELSRGLPVGGDEAAERERIHFSHEPDFSHPGGDVAKVEFLREGDGFGATLRTTLLGLLGTEFELCRRW